MDEIYKRLEAKSTKLKDDNDRIKYIVIKKMLESKEGFSQINLETAAGIFEFLEVPIEQALDLYNRLKQHDSSSQTKK